MFNCHDFFVAQPLINHLLCQCAKCVLFFSQHALKAGISAPVADGCQMFSIKTLFKLLAHRQAGLPEVWPALLAKQHGTVPCI